MIKKKKITTLNSRDSSEIREEDISPIKDPASSVPKTESTLGLKEAWRITWSHERRHGPGQEG